jgi:hypothetical protein
MWRSQCGPCQGAAVLFGHTLKDDQQRWKDPKNSSARLTKSVGETSHVPSGSAALPWTAVPACQVGCTGSRDLSLPSRIQTEDQSTQCIACCWCYQTAGAHSGYECQIAAERAGRTDSSASQSQIEETGKVTVWLTMCQRLALAMMMGLPSRTPPGARNSPLDVAPATLSVQQKGCVRIHCHEASVQACAQSGRQGDLRIKCGLGAQCKRRWRTRPMEPLKDAVIECALDTYRYNISCLHMLARTVPLLASSLPLQ